MDLNDSFSTFYPNYFNNQAASLNSWSPDWRDCDSKLCASSNEKFKSADEFDYHILVESLFNANINGNITNVSGGNAGSGDAGNYKHLSDRLKYSSFEPLVSETRKSTSPGGPLKNINWSDFESSYLTKSLSRQFAKNNSDSKTNLLSQLQSDWHFKPNVNLKTNGTGHVSKGKLSNGNLSTKSNLSSTSNELAHNINGGLNSMFSSILEDGYETRLNSSRSSDKSTNRTNLTGNVPSLNSANNNSLVNGLNYGGIGANGLLNNNLMGSQLVSGTNGLSKIGGLGSIGSLPGLGALNPNLSAKGLGKNANAQLLRNRFINNQLLNRQILNNHLLSSQVLASQNLFNGANLASTYRNLAYNGDYVVNGQFVGANEYVSGDFMGSANYLHNSFNADHNGLHLNYYDYNNYGFGKFGKSIIKSQYNFKNFKNKPIRKKRNKSELYPLASLKDADFERAMEYLRQTLISLYRDQIMPIYFNVRGRFIEFNADEIPPEHIMDICKRKPDVFNVVSNGALNETFIYLVEEPEWFTEWVDRNDLTDVYKPEMWEQFFNFIKSYKDEEGNEHFPGSIYGMSRVMQKLKLTFLEGMSLGTICHIVQLAIRLKRFLVYDVKTLKPSEAVRNNKFHDVAQISQNSETNTAVTTSEEPITPESNKNAVSGEKTELKTENTEV